MSLTEAKPTLYEEILQAFEFEAGVIESPEESRKRLAKKITDAIDNFVRAGKVEVETGITVSTTGTATAQQGTTTSKGIGKVI